jgi:Tfp pilus assembly protein PilX
MRRRLGWVLLDILMGMLIISVIGVTLGAGAAWHKRALSRLSDSRAALRVAESALTSLQAGQHVTASTVEFHPIAQGSDVRGMTWVQVSATINGRSAPLVGLVPSQSLSGGGS